MEEPENPKVDNGSNHKDSSASKVNNEANSNSNGNSKARKGNEITIEMCQVTDEIDAEEQDANGGKDKDGEEASSASSPSRDALFERLATQKTVKSNIVKKKQRENSISHENSTKQAATSGEAESKELAQLETASFSESDGETDKSNQVNISMALDAINNDSKNKSSDDDNPNPARVTKVRFDTGEKEEKVSDEEEREKIVSVAKKLVEDVARAAVAIVSQRMASGAEKLKKLNEAKDKKVDNKDEVAVSGAAVRKSSRLKSASIKRKEQEESTSPNKKEENGDKKQNDNDALRATQEVKPLAKEPESPSKKRNAEKTKQKKQSSSSVPDKTDNAVDEAKSEKTPTAVSDPKSKSQKSPAATNAATPTRRSTRSAVKKQGSDEAVDEDEVEEDINSIADFIRTISDDRKEVENNDKERDAKQDEAKDNDDNVEEAKDRDGDVENVDEESQHDNEGDDKELSNDKDQKKLPKRKRKSTSERKNTKKTRKNSVDETSKEADSSGKKSNFKPVQNWRKTIRLPATVIPGRLDAEQIFPSALPAYIPCVPYGTSQRLIDHLKETDVELVCCPGCKDR